MARNEKGEDWPKYMKEINRLTPLVSNHMNGGSSVPILNSRQSARAAGFKNQADAQAAQVEQARKDQAIEEHKTHLINKWFDEQLAARIPAWVLNLARRYNWVLKALGFRWGYWDHSHREGDMPKPMPATWVWLKWTRFVLAEQRMVWDNPSSSKRRNIITLP